MKLRVEKAVYGGAGLGHAPPGGEGRASETDTQEIAGKAIFIPLTLPGELVECEVIDDRRSFANAKLLKVLELSAGRTTPPCEYFPVCGGCHYQHATYAEQLAMKRAILAETLTHAGVPFTAGAIDMLAGEPLGYRNRIRLHVRFGDAALCYRQAGSHRDVVVDHCPIAAPLLQQALRLFPEVTRNTGLEAGLFDEVEFFTNAAQDALLLSLWTTQGTAATRALPILCEALEETLPALRGALLFQVETQKAQGRQQAAWGEPKLAYAVPGRVYTVSGGSFFQVNRLILPQMLARVLSGHRGRIAWDLYAGAGLFAAGLDGTFEQVVAVESSASSLRDLRINLPGNRFRVVASTTLDFLKTQAIQAGNRKATPDFVIVDPPRAGLGKDVTALLSQIGPADLTYISCDPATLARDLQRLLHSGYHLRKVTLVDLFPQTFHLETIAELTRT